ncbi:MAG TPA: DNA mismatch repair endonuclease MutL [Candidatus Acidoferrales bacterium]|nr:DNA mismatch repair endonuclease MutL [Candidatus Acidoferrales bacterium]
MPAIRILSDDLINKIAAGEVIERPASVVKELLENALDAGAKRLTVEVEAGGKRLIRVGDDGCGMTHDDAILAFERHATSKLRKVDDLLAIATLGFRGEALPSIASVARVVLETRPHDSNAGTHVEIHGGRMLGVREVGCAPGTQITVRTLFYNVPARRKFLRSDTTELGHVASLVTHYALAHPDKSFTLRSGDHTILDAPAVASLPERVFQVLGRATVGELIDIGEVSAPMPATRPDTWFSPEPPKPEPGGVLTARGFASRPEVQKSSSNTIFIFINRRFVRDRILLNALRESYRHVLPPRAYPMVLLFLDLPPHQVDVNVHPQKIEVRFRHQSFVHEFVQQAVRDALRQARPLARFTPPAQVKYGPGGIERRRSPRTAPPAPAVISDAILLGAEPPPVERLELEPPRPSPQEQKLPFVAPAGAPSAASSFAPRRVAAPTGAQLANLKPLGQIASSFIVAVNDSGLWLIDQHVAHERVLFEAHLRARQAGRVEGQRLLTPVVVELTPAQQVLWERLREELEANGFELDEVGPRAVAVKAAPAGIAAAGIEKLLREIFDNAEKETRQVSLDTLRQQIAATVSCHAAIKINMPLSPGKMEWLLEGLARTDNPATCPHGRPIVLQYSLHDIQRAFKRI